MKILLSILFCFFIGCFSNQLLAQCTLSLPSDTIICQGASINITANATGSGAITYSWSPSTGLSCTNCPNPTITPTATTTYSVTITDDLGCTKTRSITIAVQPLPIASFTFSPNTVCANVPVQFNPTTVIAGNQYTWNFGNPTSGTSNSSSQATPSHTFNSYGDGTSTYPVTLTVTDALGCQSTTTQSVTIKNLPQAAILDVISNFKNCDGTNFNLEVYDGTSYTGTNYEINWGDGSPFYSSATAPAPAQHTYTTADIFDLVYTVTGTNGCVDTVNQTVSNITNPAIGAANPGATTGCGPLTLCFPLSNYTFNHQSTIYTVDYGDNSPIDTFKHVNLPSSICHTYTQSSCTAPGGAFTFIIKAENPCDLSIATITPIRVYTGPVAEFANPPRACVNTGVTFTNNTIAGYNSTCSSATLYKWNFGDGTPILTTPTKTNPVHVYAAPGTYTVSLTATNSCGDNTVTHTICIEEAPDPAFTLTPQTGCVPFTTIVDNTTDTSDICQYTLNWQMTNYSTVCPATQSWSFANNTTASSWEPQFTFSGAGNYLIRLNVTNTCGTFFDTLTVKSKDIPQITLAPVGPICLGENIQPTVTIQDCAAPVTTTNWSFPSGTPANSSTITPGNISYSTVGTFPIDIVVSNGCGTAYDTVQLSVFAPPLANAGPDVNFCSGEHATIGSLPVAGVTYLWSPTTSLSTPNQSQTIAQPSNSSNAPVSFTYVVTASTSPTCFSKDSTIVTVNPIPQASIANEVICIGESVQLPISTTDTGLSYLWTPATSISCDDCQNPLASPTTTTNYSITVSNNYSCDTILQTTVTVNPLPVVNAGADLILCDQPVSMQLTGTPAGGTWTGSPNVTSSGTFTPNGTENVNLVYTYINPSTNCENTDAINVQVNPPVIPTFTSNVERCVNAGTADVNTLFAPNPTGGTWSGAGISGTTFNPITAGVGTHTLNYTYGTGTCQTVTPTTIIVHSDSVITATNPTICIGDIATPTASGIGVGGSYAWSPATGLSCTNCSNPTVSPSTTTTYTIVGTNAFGCITQTTSTITVNPLPVVNAGTDLILCNQPTSVQLTGTPAGGSWTGSPNVTSSGTFTPNGTENVNLVYTYINPSTNCENTDAINVQVNPPVIPTFTSNVERCVNAGTADVNTLFAPNPTGGTWSGAGISGTTFNPITAGVGTHTLNYTYGTGTCQTVTPTTIIVHSDSVITATNPTICIGDIATPTASGIGVGGSYAWSPATGLSCTNCSNPTVSPSTTTTYTIVGTNAFGCITQTTSTITVNPLPVVNAGTDLILCNQPTSVQLTGTPAGGSWTGSPNVTSSGTFTPNGTENVNLVYTYINPSTNCENTDAINVQVNPPVIPTFTSNVERCVNAGTADVNTLFAPNPTGGTWSGAGISGTTFNPITAGVGTHTLNYTYGTGTCQTVTPTTIIVHSDSVITATNPTICIGDIATPTASGIGVGGSYAWSPATGLSCTNCSNPTVSPSTTTTYTIVGTNAFGCITQTTSTITVNPLPVVNAGTDTLLCNQSIGVQLTTTTPGGTWSGLNITPTGLFTPSATGTFVATYTMVNGTTTCTNSDQKTITVVDPTLANAGPDLEACIINGTISVIGTPTTGTWSGTGVTPTGVFNLSTAGIFELILSNGQGNCLTKDTMFFTVHPLPVVNAGADIDICVSASNHQFVGTPANGTFTGTGITNGATGEFDPAIATVGTHEIIYTYTHPITTCINKDTVLANVRPLPVVDFDVDSIVCLNTPVTFSNNSTLVQQSNWNFGDGSTSTITTGSHTYTATGTYVVSLKITSPYGCEDSISKTIQVFAPPVIAFDVNPDSLCGPLTATFTNNSSGDGISYLWNFGNGQSSTSHSPTSQVYPAGVLADTSYTITLTGSNLCGQANDQNTVIVMPKPVAVFGTNYTTFCSPWTPEFANTSYGLPDSYSWDFGNGQTSTTNAGNFTLPTYTTTTDTSFYTIKLIVSNECGVDSMSQTIAVLPNTVTAFFNTDVTQGCAPLSVNFTQFTLGSTSYNWDFGDGNTSSTFSPNYTFNTPGQYTVTLAANNGCSYDSVQANITVYAQPSLAFTHQPDSMCINHPFDFINQSGPMINYSWDFGDGTGSQLLNPTHSYSTNGTYNVVLTGTSLDGYCTTSITHPVTVIQQAIADFSINPQIGCVPLTVQFNNLSTGYQYSSWDFGDGNTSASANPQHTYTQVGNYIVKLIVQSINGCSDTLTKFVNVNPVPTADFSFAPTFICSPDALITFTNASTGAIGYEWNFDDGTSSTLVNPEHTYNQAGNFDVELIVSNQFGCTDTIVKTVIVSQTPLPSFIIPTHKGCENQNLLFVSTSQFADSVVWDMGDGTILYGDSVYHTYNQVGNFTVSITVYNNNGCMASLTDQTPINVLSSPTADFTYSANDDEVYLATIIFDNQSTDYTSSWWDFGNGQTSTEDSPTHHYYQHSDFFVNLIVYNENGCSDTAEVLVKNERQYELFVPNAVYPNHGSIGVSQFLPKGIGLKEYHIQIYDDWGNLIWESTLLDDLGRPKEGWDATYKGEPVQQDAYVWKISATFLNEKVWEGKEFPKGKIKRSGTVTVIR